MSDNYPQRPTRPPYPSAPSSAPATPVAAIDAITGIAEKLSMGATLKDIVINIGDGIEELRKIHDVLRRIAKAIESAPQGKADASTPESKGPVWPKGPRIIAELLKESECTKAELSRMIGVQTSTVTRWSMGAAVPRGVKARRLFAVCAAYGIEVNDG